MTSLSKLLFTKGKFELDEIIKDNDQLIVTNGTNTITRLLKLQNSEIINDLELESFTYVNELINIINSTPKLVNAFFCEAKNKKPNQNKKIPQLEFEKTFTAKYYDSIFSSIEYTRKVKNSDFSYRLTSSILNHLLIDAKTTELSLRPRYILFKFNEFVNEYITSKINPDTSFSSFLFRWYEDWCYQCLEIDNPEEIIRTYNSTFHSFLWANLIAAINSKDLQYYRTYINHVFTGFNIYSRYRWSNPIPWALTTENPEIESISEKTNTLIEEFRQANLSELKSNLKELSQLEEQSKKILPEDWYNAHKYDFDMLRNNAIGNILFTPFIEFNRYLCAYALYAKSYSFIYNFWNYIQPGDSPSLNSGNEMLPKTISEILHEFVRTQNDFETVLKYPLEGYHGINHYYKQYLALLIFRQYTLIPRYTFDDFLSIEDFEKSVPTENIERYISSLNEFCIYYLSQIAENTDLFENLNLHPSLFEKDPPIPKIYAIIERLKGKSIYEETTAQLEPEKIQSFKDIIEKAYNQRALFQNILAKNDKISIDSTRPDKQYSESIIFPKKFFTNDEASNSISGLSNYAEFYLHNEIINILLQIQQNSKYKQIDNVEKFLEDLAQIENLNKKIIIGFNVLFNYQIFVDGNFKRLKEPDNSTGFVGHYEESEVYQIRNGNIPWHSILIIDKENLPVLSYKAPNQAKENDDAQEGSPITEFKNMIQNKHYLEVIDLNNDDERRRQLIECPVRNSPVDPQNRIDYENYLKTQVEFVQALSFEVKFPENFECWYFNFQEKSLSSLIG